MMALSIIGITWVQINWIRNAVRMVNENFNNAVFISLNNAASEIESMRKMNFFNNFGVNNSLCGSDTSGNIEGYFSFGSTVSHGENSLSINIGNNPPGQANSGRLKLQKHIFYP